MNSVFDLAFGAPRPRLVLKADQLGLFRDGVQHPGERGSTKWYYDRYGKVAYGERPSGMLVQGKGAAPAVREAAVPVPSFHAYDLVLVNISGGKDSQAMLDYVVEQADRQSFPRDRVVAVFADLGNAEWKGTAELALKQAAHYGVRFETVSRPQGTIAEHAEERGKWPSPQQRWCTSDHKRSQIGKVVTMFDREQGKHPGKTFRVLNCQGMRAEESTEREKLATFGTNVHYTTEADVKRGVQKRHVDDWLPIHHWNTSQVWDRIRASGVPHHEVYDKGFPRLSCVFCIFAGKEQLVEAGKRNPELLDEYVRVEKKIGHTFKQGLSMAEVKEEVERQAGIAEPSPSHALASSKPLTPASLVSVSGRSVPLPPKIRLDTDRKAGADLKRQNEWLLTEGRKEATARNDDYVTTLFSGMEAKRLSQGDKDSLHQYLFGDTQLADRNFAKASVFGLAFCAPPRLRFTLGEVRC